MCLSLLFSFKQYTATQTHWKIFYPFSGGSASPAADGIALSVTPPGITTLIDVSPIIDLIIQ